MRSGSGPDALSFLVEPDADLPHIVTHGAQVSLPTCGVENPPKFIHDPELRVRLLVIFHLRLPLLLVWTTAAADL